MSEYNTIDVTHDGPRSTIEVQRPDKLNALNKTVLEELESAATDLQSRDGLRVVVIEGEGRAFVAGADIASMVEMSAEEGRAFLRQGHDTMNAIEAIPVPVIAAVDGFALGGGLELAISCDLIVASDRAAFGAPEVKLGIIPGFGGTQRLARFVGAHRARHLIFTGERIDAETAAEEGLVLEVIAPDDFDDRVDSLAESIAARGPLAVKAAKRVMHQGEDLPLDEGLTAERHAFAELFETEDRLEGMEAFQQRRDPDFKGE
jgi:enoyl-CoA hydratase